MVIAGVVVKVVPGKENSVSKFLSDIATVSVEGTTTGNIAVVIEANSSHQLETLTKDWPEQDTDILGVYPVYINAEEMVKHV